MAKTFLITPENPEGTLLDVSNVTASNETIFNIAIDNLRQKRNALLAETDWTANSDVTMSEAMATYRQALRNITSGLDTLEKVEAKEFPTKPSE